MPEVAASADLMSPLNLFMQADIVVKLVMLGLLAASVWTWAIIFTHAIRLKRVNKQTEAFENDFWAAKDIDAFHARHSEKNLPIAVVMSAAMDEWARSTRTASVDRAGTRERLASRMNAAVATELDRLGDRLNILATVGSVAPFVGLFGTVWGIMRSFTAIAAVIAYNRLTHGLDRLEARLGRFADRFHATLSRELEVEVATGH